MLLCRRSASEPDCSSGRLELHAHQRHGCRVQALSQQDTVGPGQLHRVQCLPQRERGTPALQRSIKIGRPTDRILELIRTVENLEQLIIHGLRRANFAVRVPAGAA